MIKENKCKRCGKILRKLSDYPDSTGFVGYCYKCEKEMLKNENKKNKVI